MPVEVVSYMLSSEDAYQKLQSQLILQCAPLFKGIKAACITNVDLQNCPMLEKVFSHTPISYRVLAHLKNRALVIFYRKEQICDYLFQKEVKDFLSNYGYKDESLDATLQRLSDRIRLFSKEEITFPHEIGVFLDYPLDDVKAFIENEGQKYLLVGYWKVYHNPQRAQMTFMAYDQAKNYAVNEFLMGKSLKEIVQKAA